jgi:hypothetical protein
MAIQTNKITEGVNAIVDPRYPFRWLDAYGDVGKFLMDTSYRAADFTVTATGTSPITASVLPGAVALITTAATDFTGDNIQALGSQFKIQTDKPMYFGAKITVSDATQSDLVVGLFGVDTTLTAASSAHALDIGAGGIGFTKLDAVTTVNFKTFTATAEKNTASAITLDDTAHVYEFYWNGAALHGYVDGVLVACFTSNVTTEVLTPSIAFRAGEGAAKTCTIHWMRAIQVV